MPSNHGLRGFRFGNGFVGFANNLVAAPEDEKYIECDPVRDFVHITSLRVLKHDDSAEARAKFRGLFVFAFEPNVITISCDKPRARYQFKIGPNRLLILDKQGSELPRSFATKAACAIAHRVSSMGESVKALSLFRLKYYLVPKLVGYARTGFNDIDKIIVRR